MARLSNFNRVLSARRYQSGGGGQNSRPGLPTWARGAADYVFGDVNPEGSTGFFADSKAGQQYLGAPGIFQQIAQLLNPAMAGGSAQRDLSAGLTNHAVGAGLGLGDTAANLTTQGTNMTNMIPQLFGAANDFAGNINQAEGQAFLPAISGANQTLSNVMSPTLYNPLFQQGMKSLTPQINADFSSKGLGSSGAADAAIGQAGTDMWSQFAQRQVQEQLGAQQNLGQLGSQFAQTGIAGAQLPGQIYNQFMQGLGTQQDSLTKAGAMQLLPLQAAGMGADQYWQGIKNPMDMLNSAYATGASPMANMLTGITGVMGGISSPHVGPVASMLGK